MQDLFSGLIRHHKQRPTPTKHGYNTGTYTVLEGLNESILYHYDFLTGNSSMTVLTDAECFDYQVYRYGNFRQISVGVD